VCFICRQAIAAGANELRKFVPVAAESRALRNLIGARITWCVSGFPAGNVLSSTKYRLALHARGDQREE
jgi:hypothetical protein